MRYFPAALSSKESMQSMEKQIAKYIKKGYCYFAVDELSSGKLRGMIGISDKDFEASCTPYIDIGWPIATTFWNKGYAAEGAKWCLKFAFEELKLDRIVSIAPRINTSSIQVMKKIGMTKLLDLKHPELLDYKSLAN
ncbi:MAG: RimJ/RimL family protein N-acetyltransferase [Vicingaceae bacterium]|jgi:RimJ/RimL family protein N-acetyltransferase